MEERMLVEIYENGWHHDVLVTKEQLEELKKLEKEGKIKIY